MKIGDIVICTNNKVMNNDFPLFKPLHIICIGNNETAFEFLEFKDVVFITEYHEFITLSEYRKRKLNKISNEKIF